jgi:uncharacterized glyoxalase superfamily protein PhnB
MNGEKRMNETTKTYAASMKLRCINIVSANPKRLAEFYKIILGANIDESHGGPHRIEIWFGDKYKDSFDDKTAFIVVNYDAGFTPPTYNACQGFEIQVSDANAEYKRIQALGVEVKEPPKDLPWGYRFFNIKDPDGNGIDIVQAL